MKGVPDVAVHADAALGRLLGPGHSALAPSHMTDGQAPMKSRRGDLCPCVPTEVSLPEGRLPALPQLETSLSGAAYLKNLEEIALSPGERCQVMPPRHADPATCGSTTSCS